MRLILGMVGILAAIAAGAYVGGWLCFVGGIVQVMEAFKISPVDSMQVALGILRVVCASFVGALTFGAGILITSVFITKN